MEANKEPVKKGTVKRRRSEPRTKRDKAKPKEDLTPYGGEPTERMDEPETFAVHLEWDNPQKVQRIESYKRDQVPDIKPLRMEEIGPDYTILAIGKRREGKSFLIRFLLYHMRHIFPRVYVFTNTRMNGFWQKMVPSRFVFDGLSEGVLAMLMEQQRELINYMHDNPQFAINPRAVIIFDGNYISLFRRCSSVRLK